MSIADSIQALDMKVDSKYFQKPLIEALDLYHNLIKENVISPRENQLNHSGVMPNIVQFNVQNN